MTANLPTLHTAGDPVEPGDHYLAPRQDQAVAEVAPAPQPGKNYSVRRQARVGTDIDLLIPDMAAEARSWGVGRFGAVPVKAEVVRSGFALMASDPSMMLVDVLFCVSPDNAQEKIGKGYAALMNESGNTSEQKQLTGKA